jgi:phosphoglycolate phosphatase
MSFQAVIFDLDGTLLDTLEDIASAANRVLLKKAYPTHPLTAYRDFVGNGSEMLIRRALPSEVEDERIIQECNEAFLEDYGENWRVQTTLYKGIPELLDALTKRRMKLSVLSNKPHPVTIRCISEWLKPWRFESVMGQRREMPKKPNPAGALKIAEDLQLQPRSFLFVGDSAVDMQTAAAADMFSVGVSWGFRSIPELEESGAKALIYEPLELLKLLK